MPLAISSIVGIAASTGIAYAYGRIFAPRLAHRDPGGARDRDTRFGAVPVRRHGLVLGRFGVARRLVLPTDLDFVLLFGVRLTVTRLIALGVSLAMVASRIGLLLARTRIGLGMRALASDRAYQCRDRGARRSDRFHCLAGQRLPVRRHRRGILLANINRLDPGTLTFLVIPAIAAAIMARLHHRYGVRSSARHRLRHDRS